MIFKRFRLNIIFRVILLSLSIFALLFLILNTTLYATTYIVAAIIIFQTVSLIQYVERTNRQLTRFLEAIRHSDFSQSFSVSGLGTSFDELNQAFSQVIRDFQKERTEKEEHYRYLQTVVQHVGIGLIAFLPNGKVELVNNAAKKLLRLTQIHSLQSLTAIDKKLVKALIELKAGQKALIQVQDNDELLQLAIYATEFKLQNRAIKLVSIQNIQTELEEKEFEAWQKLIRVLTHEIMNSVTPISSLASTMTGLLSDGADQDSALQAETIADVREAARTIQKRSEGLLHFVEAYRRLTRLPKPKFQIVPVSDLFEHVHQLMKPIFLERQILFTIKIDPTGLEVTADQELISQVLINLLKNSVQALENNPHPAIGLRSTMDSRGRVILQVVDNGPGIIENVKDKIFIPFFTTKKEGTGIGLSLSRQIMRLHRGTISVQSEPNVETVFTLRF